MKRIIEKIRYHFDRFLAKGTIALVISLFLLMFMIVIVLGGILYLINPQIMFGSLLWSIFMQTLDPGNLSGETGDLMYMLMMTVATLVGIFIMSMFISIILNGFQSRLETLSRGRSKVIESNHTLILGWNDNIFVILSELVEANRSAKKPVIVILSDKDTVAMNEHIRDGVNNSYNTRIICRTGSIYKLSDLAMCSVEKARSIIVLEDDLNAIKALLVLANSPFYDKEDGHVTVLMNDKDNIEVAKTIGKGKLEVLYLRSAITRIIAQTCLQTGLSQVYNNLFEFKGDEIYFYDEQRIEGKTFAQTQFMFEKSSVIGVYRNGKTMIRPSKDTLIQAGDQLILIAADDDQIVISDDKVTIDTNLINHLPHRPNGIEEIISMIGYNYKTLEVLKEFDNYLQQGSCVNMLVASKHHAQQINEINEQLHNIKLNVTIGTTFNRATLENFLDSACRRVIIFANDGFGSGEKDSQTLLTLLHLREMEEAAHINLNIISEIADVKNAEIIDLAKSDDFIISELVASKMVSQISENRHLLPVFEDLLSIQGSEIYLKPARDYVKTGVVLDFYTLVAAASEKEEIAIGYQINHKAHLSKLILNPLKSETFTLTDADMIVVIAED
ncbi:MAG TPA: TrkA C-terminal domain-containing protein [Bacilli bacterium]|nr:TrkA C-terminal domain-containing protein [Bacilli bacterium]